MKIYYISQEWFQLFSSFIYQYNRKIPIITLLQEWISDLLIETIEISQKSKNEKNKFHEYLLKVREFRLTRSKNGSNNQSTHNSQDMSKDGIHFSEAVMRSIRISIIEHAKKVMMTSIMEHITVGANIIKTVQ